MKMTLEQRLIKAIVAITNHPRYRGLSGALMVGDRTIGTSLGRTPVPTAATNGRDEVYNPEFTAATNDAELRFLILHENYHKIFRHLTVWRWMFDMNPNLANLACDLFINITLVDDNASDGFATMTGPLTCGAFDPQYRGMDSAAIFHALLKKGQGQGQGQGGFDQHDWEGAKDMSEEDRRQLAREIDAALRQGALVAGKTGTGGDDRSLGELLQPQVDWREVLRDFITTTCKGSDYSTWTRPNRRFIGAGYYMPSGVSERVKEIAVAIDTSGSIRPRDLNAFLSEVVAIARLLSPERVHLLYWDTTVCRHEVYLETELDTLASTTKPAGGGGTMVECVPEYLTKNSIIPQATIVLTDGHLGGSWGSWSCPVLWTILDNKGAHPSNGVALHINSHQL